MMPSGPRGSPGSVNWASTTIPMIARTAKNETERQGKRAGPRWLGNVGIVGVDPAAASVRAADSDAGAAGPRCDAPRSEAS